MYLKKIKMKGFKSFARPVTINFDSSMTAIVGPNGSGKSNIVDAVRWVLGEQSARTLRGKKMADVIFAGSEDHDPLNKAHVTLVLDNRDQLLETGTDEVKIERRVNDNGESDYLINGDICRLKDIEELLLDTGLGTDTYSIIGQGKIDTIINSKPEKLRELLEEAAGITKYKVRKNEAEKRLEKTDRDLTRIKDLIAEHQKRLKPLTEEADKARKYRHLRSNLEEIEISLLLSRWEKYKREMEAVNDNNEFLQEQVELLQNEIKELKHEEGEWEEELADKEETYEEKREQRFQLRAAIDEIKNKLSINKEKKQNIEGEIERLKNSKKENRDQLEQLHTRLMELKEKGERYRTRLSDLKSEISQEEKNLTEIQYQIENKKEKLTAMRENLYQGQKRPEEIRTELNNCRERKKLLEDRNKEIQPEMKEIKEKSKTLKTAIDQCKEDIKTLKQRTSAIKEQLQQGNARLKKKRQEYRDLQNEIKSATKKLNNSKSRLKLLQEMDDQYRGYYRGVKNILQKQEEFPGIIGVVAEIIKVKSGYEKAIETALGNKIQNVVVKREEVARDAIQYLKNNNAGRVTFLPLNRIKARKYEPDKMGLNNLKGYEGLASYFVSSNIDFDITELINYLLGRTVVSPDIDSALNLSRESRQRLQIVTISGEIIYPSGAITGGNSGNNDSGLLVRNKELEELPLVIKKQQQELNQKQKDLYEKEKIIDNLSAELEAREKELLELKMRRENIEEKLTSKREKLEEYREEVDKKEDRLSSNWQKINDLQQQEADLEDRIDRQENKFEREREEIQEKTKELDKIEKEYQQLKDKQGEKRVELARRQQQLENIEREKKEVLKNSEQLKKQQQVSDEKISEQEDEVKKLEEKKIKLKEKSREMQETEARLNNEGEKLQRQLEQLRKLINSQQEKIEGKQQELEKTKEKLHRVELKVNRLQGYCERDESRLREEYDINPGQDKYRKKINIKSQKKARNKIEEIKEAMQRLEPVNEGAIREFEDLKDRVFYLQEQRGDLIEAREGIVQVIREIEKSMGDKFYATFQELAGEFSNIFRELFDGGKAELKLDTPEDLLETGVEINAQPPGKQLKKLSLLSGGERALTAIALIFAILRVKPSPFYILDEIDAPLDDANVVKFGRFIQNYTDFAQFIIITHRKHMMTRVDSIYGVTMEESGVSKIVSLNFRELIEQTGG